MSWIPILISLILGIFIGLGAAVVLRLIQAKTAKDLAEELCLRSESKNRENLMELIEGLKESFGSLSLEALSRSTQEFLKLAKATLEPEREATLKELDVRKEIIDRQLQRMTGELDKVSNLMKELERDRVEKFGELASQLKSAEIIS